MNGNTHINMASDHSSIMASSNFGFISSGIDIEDRTVDWSVHRELFVSLDLGLVTSYHAYKELSIWIG